MNYERFLSAIAYLFFGLGGVISIFLPYKVLVSIANPQTAYVWAAFMALGGLISFVGALKHSWTIEQMGLPLLIMSFTVLAIIAITSLFTGEEHYVSSGLFSLGNVAFFTMRYIRIKKSIIR